MRRILKYHRTLSDQISKGRYRGTLRGNSPRPRERRSLVLETSGPTTGCSGRVADGAPLTGAFGFKRRRPMEPCIVPETALLVVAVICRMRLSVNPCSALRPQ